jgi:hypothetical protein
LQHTVEAVRAPRAEHAHDIAAADVDHILCQQMRREVLLDATRALVAAEERDVAGLTARREAPVEAHHVVVGVTGGRRQEADVRSRPAGQREHVVVEQRILALHREAASAEGDDLGSWWLHGKLTVVRLTSSSIAECAAGRYGPQSEFAGVRLDIRRYGSVAGQLGQQRFNRLLV